MPHASELVAMANVKKIKYICQPKINGINGIKIKDSAVEISKRNEVFIQSDHTEHVEMWSEVAVSKSVFNKQWKLASSTVHCISDLYVRVPLKITVIDYYCCLLLLGRRP